jgi:hypothetical protein
MQARHGTGVARRCEDIVSWSARALEVEGKRVATRGVLEGYSRGLGLLDGYSHEGYSQGYSVRALEVERERVRERRDARRGLDEHKALRDLGADLLIGAR